MRTRSLLLMLPLVAAGCGGPLFSVGGKAERVCVRQGGESLDLSAFTAVMPAGATIPAGLQLSGSIERDFSIDAGDLSELAAQDVSARLGLLSFDLQAPELLAGVNVLQVSLQPPAGSTLPPVTLANYRADGSASQDGAVIRIDGDTLHVDLAASQQDLAEYLEARTLDVHLAADATVPSTLRSVTVAVELCTTVDASYDYGKKLGL